MFGLPSRECEDLLHVGPFFIEDAAGLVEAVNGTRYRARMLTNFFWPELNSFGRGDLLFQQKDSICHTAAETLRHDFQAVSHTKRGSGFVEALIITDLNALRSTIC